MTTTAKQELDHKYAQLCAEVGHFVIHHLLFDPLIVAKMKEIHQVSQDIHNLATKGTDAETTNAKE